MGAALHRQTAVGVGGVHLEGGRLNTGLLRVGGVHDLGRETMPLSPPHVHSQEHLRPVGCIHSAGTRADSAHGSTLVVLTVQQGLNHHVSQVEPQRVDLLTGLHQSVLIMLLLAQLLKRLDIVQPGGCRLQMLELGLQGREPAGHLLGVLLIVPESRRTGLTLQISNSRAQALRVQRLGNHLVLGLGLLQ